MATISVPQQDGEIVLTRDGNGQPVTYEVTRGQVTVPDGDEALHFVSVVPGAELVEASADKSSTKATSSATSTPPTT